MSVCLTSDLCHFKSVSEPLFYTKGSSQGHNTFEYPEHASKLNKEDIQDKRLVYAFFSEALLHIQSEKVVSDIQGIMLTNWNARIWY